MSKEITAPHGGLEGILMTNKQVTEGHSMNNDHEEGEVRFTVDQAMALHAEAVAAGEESSDPSESFRCGVEYGVRFARVMMMIEEEYEIEAEEEAFRAANN